jgi:hypothetical protein
LDPNPFQIKSLIAKRPYFRESTAPVGGYFPKIETVSGKDITFSLRGVDPDRDTLVYFIVEEPSRGQLQSTSGGILRTRDITGNEAVRFTAESWKGGNPYTTFRYGVTDGVQHDSEYLSVAVYVKCPEGHYLNQGTFSCIPCSPGHFQSTPSYEPACFPCQSGSYQSNSTATRCVPCPFGFFQDMVGGTGCKSCEEFGHPTGFCPSPIRLNSSQRAGLIGFDGIGFAIMTLLATTLFSLRRNRIFFSGSILFMFYTIFGCFMILTGSIFNALPVDAFHCTIKFSLYSTGYTLAIGPIVIKMIRLYRIFNNKRMQKLRYISNQACTLFLIGLLLIDVLLLSIWFGSAPFIPISDTNYFCTSNQSQLFSGLLVIYKVFLLLLGLWATFMNRNAPSLYNETKVLTLCFYNVAFMGIIHLAVNYGLFYVVNYATFLVIDNFLWTFTTISSVVIMFFPRYWLYFKDRSKASSIDSSQETNFSQIPKKSTYQPEVKSVAQSAPLSPNVQTSPIKDANFETLLSFKPAKAKDKVSLEKIKEQLELILPKEKEVERKLRSDIQDLEKKLLEVNMEIDFRDGISN